MTEELKKAGVGVRMPSFITHSPFIEPLLCTRIYTGVDTTKKRTSLLPLRVDGSGEAYSLTINASLCGENWVEQCVEDTRRVTHCFWERRGGPVPR